MGHAHGAPCHGLHSPRCGDACGHLAHPLPFHSTRAVHKGPCAMVQMLKGPVPWCKCSRGPVPWCKCSRALCHGANAHQQTACRLPAHVGAAHCSYRLPAGSGGHTKPVHGMQQERALPTVSPAAAAAAAEPAGMLIGLPSLPPSGDPSSSVSRRASPSSWRSSMARPAEREASHSPGSRARHEHEHAKCWQCPRLSSTFLTGGHPLSLKMAGLGWAAAAHKVQSPKAHFMSKRGQPCQLPPLSPLLLQLL